MPDVIAYARTIADRTDADVLSVVDQLPQLLSKATSNERVAYDRIMRDLARRLRRANSMATAPRPARGVESAMAALNDAYVDSAAADDARSDRALQQAKSPDVDAAMAQVHEILVDSGTMEAIHRVRAFQQVADEQGFGRQDRICYAKNPRNGWECSLHIGAEHTSYVDGRHLTVIDGERYDWHDTADGRPRG